MSGTALHGSRSTSYSGIAARAAVVAAVVGAAVLVWYAVDVLLLVFGAVIVAVALRSLVLLATRYTPLGERWALVLVTLLLLTAIAGLGALIGSRVAQQFGQLMQTLHSAWLQLHASLEDSELGRTLLNVESQTASTSSAAHLAGAATSSIGAITDAVLILFIGVFLAAEPRLYRRGMISLVPGAVRASAAGIMDELANALTRWMQGVLVAMVCVGVATSIGLILLGIPLALSLGILAGVCEFVPYLGPIVSSVPAILVAFTSGPLPAVEVAGLFLLVHALEGYVLVPLIQRRAVALPPALALIAVALFGIIFGPLGVIFAHPLMVCVIVLVKRLYIRPEALEV